ncbi:FtsW/RodA/SpoVE family cell cycle protein [Paenibacillus elgii]
MTKPNISILLTPLEHDGYICRSGHPEDGRKTVISITRRPGAAAAILAGQPRGNRGTYETCPDLSGRYLIVGVISMFTLQIFESIMMHAGMMPLTGIALPFIS